MKKERRCLECGEQMTHSVRATFQHEGCGLPHVYLQDIDTFTCVACGAKDVQITDLEGLLNAIFTAILLVNRPLKGAEIRFVRRRLGLRAKDFAKMIGYSAEVLSEIENERYEADRSKFDRSLRGSVIAQVLMDEAHCDIRPTLMREGQALHKKTGERMFTFQCGPPVDRFTFRCATPHPHHVWIEAEKFLAA